MTAGADVGKDHIEVGVSAWGRARRRWLVDHFRIEGNTQLPKVWEEAADAVHRVYRNAEGVEFSLLKFFIDTSAWPEIVKPWVRRQNQQIVMGCDGLDHLDQAVKVEVQAEPVRGMPNKKTRIGALRIAQVGVSLLKAELVGVLSIPRPESSDEAPPDWLHLPKQGFTKEMAKQLVSERKVILRDANGRLTGTRWERIEGRRAEVLDCHNYAVGRRTGRMGPLQGPGLRTLGEKDRRGRCRDQVLEGGGGPRRSCDRRARSEGRGRSPQACSLRSL
nr:terminase gpA endonuclease subunit [Tianweitania sediminis]